MTRINKGETQVLVFQHPIAEAGIQIPKGTVKSQEDAYQAVIREIKEETGLENIRVEDLIAEDLWENADGAIHHRSFIKSVYRTFLMNGTISHRAAEMKRG